MSDPQQPNQQLPAPDAQSPQTPSGGTAPQTLDLEDGVEKSSSAEVNVPNQTATFSFSEAPYNQAKAQDATRKWISYSLLILLGGIVLFAFILLEIINGHALDVGQTAIDAIRAKGGDPAKLAPILQVTIDESKANSDRLIALLNIVFGPVVTLLGSVTGFYFGAQTAKGNSLGGSSTQ